MRSRRERVVMAIRFRKRPRTGSIVVHESTVRPFNRISQLFLAGVALGLE